MSSDNYHSKIHAERAIVLYKRIESLKKNLADAEASIKRPCDFTINATVKNGNGLSSHFGWATEIRRCSEDVTMPAEIMVAAMRNFKTHLVTQINAISTELRDMGFAA